MNSSSGQSTQFLLANREGLTSGRVLEDETGIAGFSGSEKSSGLAVADYNEDGFSDVYFSKASSKLGWDSNDSEDACYSVDFEPFEPESTPVEKQSLGGFRSMFR